MPRRTDDLRIIQTRPLVPPAILHEELPVTDPIADLVIRTRAEIVEMLHGRSRRLLVILGPCSIHDPTSALEVATRIAEIQIEVQSELLLLMRAYFEKPRTTVGWKGFINDPDLDESGQINKGLRLSRKLLLDINALGVPTASEFLDLQIPQHLADITSWVAIGARTTESQVHRELVSGLSMPVGFKNTTEGGLLPAVEAVLAARSGHWFPSVTKQAVGAIFQTTGNPDCHVILRGGSETGPNFDEHSVAKASALLESKRLPNRVMIDCSHGNSRKDFRAQVEVLRDVSAQILNGSRSIMGLMLESHLIEGRQDLKPGVPLTYGQSITDSCLSMDVTSDLLLELATSMRSN